MDVMNWDVKFCEDCDQCQKTGPEYYHCKWHNKDVPFYQRACGTYYPNLEDEPYIIFDGDEEPED